LHLVGVCAMSNCVEGAALGTHACFMAVFCVFHLGE